jgi:putative PIN family toxin of toxin-antitoxin system
MRVILDTNILCSALITPGGLADRLYLAWRGRLFTLVTSEQQLEEFRRVTRYPRVRQYIEPAAAGTLHNELRRLAVMLAELPVIEASRDPWDDFLLAMAQAGKADFLVTGDKRDLLSMGSFAKTRIVTARQMLDELQPQGAS